MRTRAMRTAPIMGNLNGIGLGAIGPTQQAQTEVENNKGFFAANSDALISAGTSIANTIIGSAFGNQANNPPAPSNTTYQPPQSSVRAGGGLTTPFLIAGGIGLAGLIGIGTIMAFRR